MIDLLLDGLAGDLGARLGRWWHGRRDGDGAVGCALRQEGAGWESGRTRVVGGGPVEIAVLDGSFLAPLRT